MTRRARVRIVSLAAATALALAASACAAGAYAASPAPPPTARVVGHPALGPNDQLTAMDFAGALDGVLGLQRCAGASARRCTGEILLTADGGRSWHAAYTGGYAVSDVAISASGRLWAVVDRGGACNPNAVPAQPCRSAVLVSLDHGRTWATALATRADVAALYPGTDGRAWVGLNACKTVAGKAVCAGRLVQVGDGASSLPRTAWQGPLWVDAIGGPPAAPLVVVAGVGRGGGRVAVLATGNGGRSFARRSTVARAAILDPGIQNGAFETDIAVDPHGAVWVSYASLDSCAMHGCAYAGVDRSIDGGRTWQPVVWPKAPPGTAGYGCGLFGAPPLAAMGSVILIGQTMGLAACPGPATTLDVGSAGSTLTARAYDWPGTPISSLRATAGGTVFALAPGALLASTDTGRRWRQVWPRPVPTAAIDMLAGGRTGFGLGMAGDDRAVLATSDGGRAWARVGELPVEGGALSFADRRTGLAVGWNRAANASWSLWATANGSRTWARVDTLSGQPYALRMWSPSRASLVVAVGAAHGGTDLALLTSADRGSTWRLVARRPVGEGVVTAALAGSRRAAVLGSSAGITWLGTLAPGARLDRAVRVPTPGNVLYPPVLAATATSAAVAFPVGYRPPGVSPGQGQTVATVIEAGSPSRWAGVSLPPGLSGPTAMDALGPDEIWLVTGAYGATFAGSEVLLRTRDGGRTWTVLGPSG